MKNADPSSPVIENIVSSGSVADAIDLDLISQKIANCTFSSRFPGAVFHMEEPKSVALIFSSGKIVLTGIVRHEDIPVALANLIANLRGAGIACTDSPAVVVKNIVCTYTLAMPCSLVRIMQTLMDHEQVEYEPECFPGLVCRIDDPKIVFLIFSSGKVVITGGKTMEDVHRGLGILLAKLAIAGSPRPEESRPAGTIAPPRHLPVLQ